MNSSHLLSLPKSGDTFYFRKYIPADLIEHFGGVKEFRISLVGHEKEFTMKHYGGEPCTPERLLEEIENLIRVNNDY